MIELQFRHGICRLDDEDAWVLDGWWWWSQQSSRRKGVAPGRPLYYIYGTPVDAADRLRRGEKVPPRQMHRVIMSRGRRTDGDYADIDHIDGDGLNNQRSNLRVCTRSQNLANSGSRRGTSKYKGVSFEKQTGRWKAQIMVDGKQRNLGRYDTEDEAGMARNLVARQLQGDFARLNDVPDGVVPVRKPRASSKYVGVSFDRTRGLWVAQLMVDGKQHHIGRYRSELTAVRERNQYAKLLLGDRAVLSAIPEDEDVAPT